MKSRSIFIVLIMVITVQDNDYKQMLLFLQLFRRDCFRPLEHQCRLA